MAFYHKHFVRTSVVLLLTVSLCYANIESLRFTFTGKKGVTTSHTTLHDISDIQCARKCNKERQNGRCTLAGYDKQTKTCYLSDDDPLNVTDIDDEMTGVFFYEMAEVNYYEPVVTVLTCDAPEPLLNGANPVPDTYFTASGVWDASPTGTLPHFARMTAIKHWAPDGTAGNPNPSYLQVRFLALSTVVRVATKGGACWATHYRLAYSEDCVSFTNILDVDGNNKTFTGNTDKNNIVENQLPALISALCVRLHPLAWDWYPDVKMEVYGCPSV